MAPIPSAKCLSCGFAWYSATMAEGLRALGKCPRCKGELAFGERAPEAEQPAPRPVPKELPPHLVLGLPRR